MYYKGKWCTAGGKDPLFGHVDGFQIDPISWAATHNSARSLRQDFCSNSKFRKWRNTVCISHFRNCGSGAKRRLRLADAIARCCLRNYFHSTRNEFCFHEIMSSLDFFFILSILSAVLRRPTLWIDSKFILEIDI